MATAIAERIVGNLIAASIVEEDDKALYIYGFFLLITHFFFFLIAVAFGCSMKIPLEGVIFYFVFVLLRSYAGGAHAKTETACTMWTTLAIGASIAAVKVIENSVRIVFPLLFLSNFCIFLFSPLESKEKPLDNNDRRNFRKICCGQLLACNIVIFASLKLSCPALYGPVICGMSLEAVLLCIGKMCN